jgi:small subunit ribosomal protein S3
MFKTASNSIAYLFSMAQKTHPVGIRLGITLRPCSRWYADRTDYAFFLREDQHIRNYVSRIYRHCTLSKIEIARRGIDLRIRISAAQVRSLVGKKGKMLSDLIQKVQHTCQRFRLNYFRYISLPKDKVKIRERPGVQVFLSQVTVPEADARCLADSIVIELEKRTPFRRILRISQDRAQSLGQVIGLRLQISGRLNGAEIARTEWIQRGRVPLNTFSIALDYSYKSARTIYGLLGVKVWIQSPALYIAISMPLIIKNPMFDL